MRPRIRFPAGRPTAIWYYFSDRDGFRCIWARRLAAGTKKPAGDPIAVYHSHTTRLSLRNENFGTLALAISRDKLAFTMNEQTGNIWMMRP
jgi:eukaryotic-like serine/threonine-protein kinase